MAPGRLPKLFSITDSHTGIYGAAGLHPWWVARWLEANPDAELSDQLTPFFAHPHCVAVGECGLDGAIDTALSQQQPLFERQLQLANDCKLPVIIHVRKAHNAVLQLLKRIRPARGGVIHGFSGSVELALDYWRLGFRLGIGGAITYRRARKTRTAAAALPLDALLLETDAPDMPLADRQGKPNSPAYLPEVAHCLAELRGQSLRDIALQTSHNAQQLFGLKG